VTRVADTHGSSPKWLEKEPAEVQRSIRAIEALDSKGSIDLPSPSFLSQMSVYADLEGLFSCT
jgi:hypothetical protein